MLIVSSTRRLVDEDRLEAPLEGGVLLDVLAVLVERRRADRVQLPARQHRLEQVGGVHRPLGRAGADDGVQLVDEQDDPAVAVLDLLEDGLEPLLELAAELGPGDERPEVERDDALVLERLGHVAAHDALGEALDDGRLADARLADEDRVVLRPAAEHLDGPADLVVAPDDRVELAGARLDGQVAPVLLEGGVGALGVLGGDALAAADALERLEDGLLAGGMTLEQGLRLAAGHGHAQEQVLGRDVLVAQAAGLGLGLLDDGLGARVERQRAALDAGALGQHRRDLAAEHRAGRRRGGAGSRPGCRRRARRGALEQVLGVEHRALQPGGRGLGGEDGLLGLLGEAIELHGQVSRVRGSGWSTRSMNVRGGAPSPRRTGRSAGRRGP